MDGAGTVLFLGANSYNQGTTINGGTVAFRNNTSGGANFTINNGATLEFTNTSSQQIQNGTISGNGTLLKQAPAGTLTTATVLMLGGNGKPENIALTNGLIDVEGGTLRNEYGNKNWTNNLAPMVVAAGAMFDVWDGYAQVDALNGSGTINKGWNVNCNFAMGVNNGSGTFNGKILNNYTYSGYGSSGGSLSIIKVGTGTQTLTGVNTWTGSTTIGNGTLVIGGAGLLGGGTYAGAIINNGIFNYGSSANQVLAGVISGTGSLIVSGSGTLMLDGANTYTGATTINAGTLGGNGFITGAVTNPAGGTLQPGLGNGDTSTLTVSNNVVLAGTNYFCAQPHQRAKLQPPLRLRRGHARRHAHGDECRRPVAGGRQFRALQRRRLQRQFQRDQPAGAWLRPRMDEHHRAERQPSPCFPPCRRRTPW